MKQEVAKFVSDLRDFNQRMEALKPSGFFQEIAEESRDAKTEEEKSKVGVRYFYLYNRLLDEWSEQRKREYDKNYQGKAITLHDKMLNRIPLDKIDTDNLIYYQHLAGPSPIAYIAIDLERLSNLLPN